MGWHLGPIPDVCRRRLGPLAALAMLATASTAMAGNVYLIRTASAPPTNEPITGGGSWILNRPNGYYIGRAVVNTRFDVVYSSSAGWGYGRAIDTVNMCGWVMPGALATDPEPADDSCSSTTREHLSHRLSIGKDFDAPTHQMSGGSSVWASGSCPFFYNYFYGTNFAGGANAGRWANFAGYTTAGYVLYRYTTLDGGAVVARDPNLGWGFAPSSCVGRPATVHNDND